MSLKLKLMSRLVAGLGFVVLAIIIAALPFPSPTPTQFGVSFSPAQARGLGLNWQETYQALLHDLGVRQLRLGVYWKELEPVDDQFDFTALDYQMNEAAKTEAQVMLTLGRKVQRWPECHDPAWLAGQPESEVREELLEMMTAVTARYRTHPALRQWQLENEPFLRFGPCPSIPENLLAREEALLRSLDSNHPIVITDSGELNWWIAASRYGDILGTTMYRTVFSQRTNRPFSYDFIFPAWLYRLKARGVGLGRGKEVIISELQGEPWGKKPFVELDKTERMALLSPDRLQEIHRFAKRTGLPVAYWWGAEYWYWEKTTRNQPAYWEAARSFFCTGSMGTACK